MSLPPAPDAKLPDLAPTNAATRHVPALDGLRGLAVLAVMLTHFVQSADGNLKDPVTSEWLDGVTPLDRLLRAGWHGVDLFFVLSGYLITARLLAAPREHYFRNFYVRRTLRIFPLYYFALAVAYLSVVFVTPGDAPALVGASHPVWYFLYVPNVAMAVTGTWLAGPTWFGLGHFWSLAVEEQFYLFWPLVTRFVSRHRLWLACLATFGLALGITWWLRDKGMYHAAYVLTPCRMVGLALGALVAALEPRLPHARLRAPTRWASYALTAAIVYAIGWDAALPIATETLLLTLFVTLVVVSIVSERSAVRVIESPVLRWFGTYSYGLYVYHHLLQPVWMRAFSPEWLRAALGGRAGGLVGYVVLAGGCSMILSYASWHLFEKRVLRYKVRYGGE